MAVEREIIPDAVVGSAPTLDMIRRRRPLHSMPQSDGGESHHSLAMSSLAGMQLDQEGIPIAVKIAQKTFKYFDADENQLSKEEAMEVAGGVVYYQDANDPAKGRLRHRGSFVSKDDARSIASGSRAGSVVSGSRVSRRSDVANVRDLLEPLHPVKENEPPNDDDDDHLQCKESRGRHRLVHLVCFIVPALVLFVASRSSTSTQLVLGETKLLQGLDPGLAELLAKHESMDCKEGDNDCKAALSKGYFLDAPVHEEVFDEHSVESRKKFAAAEVERILTTKKVSEILGGYSRSEQRHAFRRIVQLLHPDKGLVSSHDARAALALRLAYAARDASRD